MFKMFLNHFNLKSSSVSVTSGTFLGEAINLKGSPIRSAINLLLDFLSLFSAKTVTFRLT